MGCRATSTNASRCPDREALRAQDQQADLIITTSKTSAIISISASRWLEIIVTSLLLLGKIMISAWPTQAIYERSRFEGASIEVVLKGL